MPTFNSQFVFLTCQLGAERALKQELARKLPALRLAYSRPGFLTFKLPDAGDASSETGQSEPQPIAAPPPELSRLVFARTAGWSLGKLQGDRLSALAAAVWNHPQIVELSQHIKWHDLHVWQRDQHPVGRHGYRPGTSALSAEAERAIREAAPVEGATQLLRPRIDAASPAETKTDSPQSPSAASSSAGGQAGRSQNVLDCVLVEPGEWWIGCHRVTLPQHRWAGGVPPIEFPPHAVSRAYLKMREALAWSRLPVRPGEGCVEIGCAPGGASQALLECGLAVTGIDPAEVDPQVLADPNFRHLQKRAADVRRREFRQFRWLAADLNVAPKYTLDAVEDIVTHPSVTVRGLVLTLKLPDWKLADELDEYVGRVRGWGFRDVRVRQLAHNSQEVCLVALRSRSLRRLPKRRGRKQLAAIKHTSAAESCGPETAHHRIDPPHQAPAGPHGM